MAKNEDKNPEPGKSKKELVLEAQEETQADLTKRRLEFIEAFNEHDSIGGVDDIEQSLMEIVRKYPKGIAFSILQMVFPDTLLVKAREDLKKKGEIKQEGKKGRVLLLPVTKD